MCGLSCRFLTCAAAPLPTAPRPARALRGPPAGPFPASLRGTVLAAAGGQDGAGITPLLAKPIHALAMDGRAELGHPGGSPLKPNPNPSHPGLVQMGRRISLMHRWAPRTDPLLCGLLLALHATLLLRLALLGGLERLPLPLAGAYLSWLHLRMGHDWVRCVRCHALACHAMPCLSTGGPGGEGAPVQLPAILLPAMLLCRAHAPGLPSLHCSQWAGCVSAACCCRPPSCCWLHPSQRPQAPLQRRRRWVLMVTAACSTPAAQQCTWVPAHSEAAGTTCGPLQRQQWGPSAAGTSPYLQRP